MKRGGKESKGRGNGRGYISQQTLGDDSTSTGQFRGHPHQGRWRESRWGGRTRAGAVTLWKSLAPHWTELVAIQQCGARSCRRRNDLSALFFARCTLTRSSRHCQIPLILRPKFYGVHSGQPIITARFVSNATITPSCRSQVLNARPELIFLVRRIYVDYGTMFILATVQFPAVGARSIF
jgi:hypothetical protein